jgi:type II secretory pathway pseudopilin PulG
MKHEYRRQQKGPSGVGAFSLVEVTIAIGIFAFVMVAILGLFPTATKMRADSALETRAVMIAQQLFSYVESSGSAAASPVFSPIVFSVTNVALRDGPALVPENTRTNINLMNPGGVVVGYQNRSSMPYYFFGMNNPGAWTNMPANVEGATTTTAEKEITTLARIWASTNTGSFCHQYRVTVEVRSPASVPLTNSSGQTNPSLRVVQFVKFF